VFSDVEFSEIIEGTALNFEPVAFERGVMIDTQLDENVWINGNALQLKQLAHILIDNAVKYSADNSTVTVALHKSGDIATLSVNNHGKPIAEEDLEHIFDRFYRAEKSRTTKGYGLGLSIAQNIVQSMNGKITAASSEKDGTTFTVQLKSENK
jgi:signal transduction histidine kinase